MTQRSFPFVTVSAKASVRQSLGADQMTYYGQCQKKELLMGVLKQAESNGRQESAQQRNCKHIQWFR